MTDSAQRAYRLLLLALSRRGDVMLLECQPTHIAVTGFQKKSFPMCVAVFQFAVSLREVELMMAYRGVQLSYETIRRGCETFGASYSAKLKRKRPKLGGDEAS